MKMSRYKEGGFTTVEMMVALLIAGIIMAAIGTFLVFHVNGFNESRNIIALQREGQLTMNQLSEMLSESTGIESASASEVRFKVISDGESRPDTIRFDSTDKAIYGSGSGVSEYLISEHVKSFYLEAASPIYKVDSSGTPTSEVDWEKINLVKISLGLSKGEGDDEQVVNLEREIKLRNVSLD